jgi:hypothetical protein
MADKIGIFVVLVQPPIRPDVIQLRCVQSVSNGRLDTLKVCGESYGRRGRITGIEEAGGLFCHFGERMGNRAVMQPRGPAPVLDLTIDMPVDSAASQRSPIRHHDVIEG